MDNIKMGGIIVPVITPVDDQDRVDEASFRAQIRRLIKAGIHGIFVGGSAGEGPLLTAKEWERMVTIGFEEGNGKVHLLGGAIDTSTKRIIERIKVLKQVGYKNIVVAPTFYITANHPTEHLRLFGECKEQCGAVNMIAYNIPSTTSSMIQSDVMTDMVKRGWITYCKDSSEDMEYFHRLVRDAVPLGLRVFLGTERKADEALLAGAVGLVPVNGNFEPQTFISAYENRTNKEELTRLQKRITSLVTNLLQTPRNWLAGIKYAVSSTHGIGSGRPVSPLEPLNEEEKRKMDEFIKATAPAAIAVH